MKKTLSLYERRKKPINLSFQRIEHWAGLNFILPNFYTLSKTLNQSLGWINHQIEIDKRNSPKSFDKKTADKYTSIGYLREVMESGDDNKPKHLNLGSMINVLPTMSDIIGNLADSLRYLYDDIEQSGNFMYPPNGFMGWHTNYKRPGARVYLVYSENGDSEFKYSFGDYVGVIKEKKGWNVNIFRVDIPPSKIWHSVNAGTGYRISYGFRIDDRNI